VRAGRLHLR